MKNAGKKCTICGGDLKHYDTVDRIVRRKGGVREMVKIDRYGSNVSDAVETLIRAIVVDGRS